MTASSHLKGALRAKIEDHFEAGLAVMGIGVAVAATVAVLVRGEHDVALICVVWFQGLILWAVLLHSRLGREHLVRKLRVMLQDRVNNQLTSSWASPISMPTRHRPTMSTMWKSR